MAVVLRLILQMHESGVVEVEREVEREVAREVMEEVMLVGEAEAIQLERVILLVVMVVNRATKGAMGAISKVDTNNRGAAMVAVQAIESHEGQKSI